MSLNLPDAGLQRPSVTVLVIGCAFVMGVVDFAAAVASVFLVGDVPAVLCVLRLKRDAVASGKDDSEISAVYPVDILLCEHGQVLLSQVLPMPFGVVY